MIEFFQSFIPAHRRLAQGTLAFATIAALAGCGSTPRPTTTPITPTGPASQPASFAFVISTPLPTAQTPVPQGVGTVIDYSGDTIMASAQIGPNPVTFALNGGGSEAWTLNGDGTVSNIPVSTNLQPKLVTYSTLSQFNGADPVVGLFNSSLGLYALDTTTDPVTGKSQLDVLTGSPDAFKLTVPVDQTPVTMVGVSSATRYYTISQNIPYGIACNTNPTGVTQTGTADGIETLTYTVSSQIPLGVCPVYAVGTPDTKRVFVLNRGSDTITVINSQNNAPDQCPANSVNQNGQPFKCHPVLPLSTTAVNAICPTPTAATCVLPPNGTTGFPAVAGPVYAEYNQATGQLVVSNYDGNTISIIDVSLDEFGNDSPTFGTTFTVAVGNNPAAVTVLADGSRAYVANQSGDAVNGSDAGSVTIVNMNSHTIEKTLPVTGHPRTVVSTENSLFGKVYVASPDSPDVTIIRTDQDIISTSILVQGNAIDVRTTSPDASSANTNTVSRLPGAGQPCFLPPTELTPTSVADCQLLQLP
ncbi:YncE family protein [Acidicapsa ligni]|uniref:YncE family protein n=1 Tax=Acidicapsa ligni TaxID=542300 RepID=UPI0021E0ED4A|nr:hypothetical protein [Acidicapsa ligni]